MTILKCKMCGGDIQISEDQFIGTCDSCGSTMTLPRVPDEQRANFFNRANHFRRQGEFDKAIAAYESILNQDDTDAEAHWGVVLSRYGIEYVEDPISGERVPTCHRVQIASILDDADYLAALEHAPDGYSRELYEHEAKRIAEIQKGILALSAQEQPYDVFICYKETSEAGTRTPDSALAQDVYYQLTQASFKVFFSRITLEDKLGQQYEPYIFAAINSAKVMVVIGTQPEYFNAVWVKNEWSRFLALMKKDRNRLLIPCYRDMDAYDLPEALSMLQSQDMGKIGFIQDLIRGIKKIVDNGEKQQSYGQPTEGHMSIQPLKNNVPSLMKRGQINLEDSQWHEAASVFEQALRIEPENGEAYLGKLYAQMQFRSDADFRASARDVSDIIEFKRAIMYLSSDKKQQYQKIAEDSRERAEENRRRKEKLRSIQGQLTQQLLDKESIIKSLQKTEQELLNFKNAMLQKEGREKTLRELRTKNRVFLLLGVVFGAVFYFVNNNYNRTNDSAYEGYEFLTSGVGDALIVLSTIALAGIFLIKGIFGNKDELKQAKDQVARHQNSHGGMVNENSFNESIRLLTQKKLQCEKSIELLTQEKLQCEESILQHHEVEAQFS